MVLGPGAGPAPVPFPGPVDGPGDGSGPYPCLKKCPARLPGANPPSRRPWGLAPRSPPNPRQAWEFHSHRRPVVVDEFRVAKRLLQRGDFEPSKPTIGDNTWLIVGVELNREDLPRRSTGRSFCCLIPDRTSGSIRHILEPRLLPNSVVWTDELPSYNWLVKAGHVHECNNHERREFSRERGRARDLSWHRIPSKRRTRLFNGLAQRPRLRLRCKTTEGIRISSNAAEGFVALTRKHLRTVDARARLGGSANGEPHSGRCESDGAPGVMVQGDAQF